MIRLLPAIFLIVSFVFISLKDSTSLQNQPTTKSSKQVTKEVSIDSLTAYQTKNLVVKKLSNHVYTHISYLNTDDYGKVACNGMLVINENKAIIFDTPTDNKSSIELIKYVANELNCEIIAIIPTHFHVDCVGGIEAFEKYNIPIFLTYQTAELLKKNGQFVSSTPNEFDDTLILEIGSKKVYAEYFGEGHAKDNIIGYFPDEKALFGGCLIKKVDAGKGNLEDANTKLWPETVRNIKLKYPKVEIVIPGHGKWGGVELFDYTIALFE